MTPYPFHRIIACARRLMARQGLPRRRAIAAAIQIVCRNSGSSAPKTHKADPDQAARLERLTHRARSMRAWRPA